MCAFSGQLRKIYLTNRVNFVSGMVNIIIRIKHYTLPNKFCFIMYFINIHSEARIPSWLNCKSLIKFAPLSTKT